MFISQIYYCNQIQKENRLKTNKKSKLKIKNFMLLSTRRLGLSMK